MLLVQDHARAVEAQLANTMQELQELKARHQQLEAKNLLLEKLQSMRKDSTIQHASSDVSFFATTLLCAVLASTHSPHV